MGTLAKCNILLLADGKQSMRRYPQYNQATTTSSLAGVALIPPTTNAKQPTVNS